MPSSPESTVPPKPRVVLGVGGGRRRWRHVHWAVVRHIALGWLITMPATAAFAAAAFATWGSL